MLYAAAGWPSNCPRRVDVAMWRGGKGKWHGVLQGRPGPVLAALSAITADWLRLAVPPPLTAQARRYRKPLNRHRPASREDNIERQVLQQKSRSFKPGPEFALVYLSFGLHGRFDAKLPQLFGKPLRAMLSRAKRRTAGVDPAQPGVVYPHSSTI